MIPQQLPVHDPNTSGAASSQEKWVQGLMCNVGADPEPSFEPFFPREALLGPVLLLGQIRSGKGCSTWSLAASSMSSAWKLPQTGIFLKCCCLFSGVALLKFEVPVIAVFLLSH